MKKKTLKTVGVILAASLLMTACGESKGTTATEETAVATDNNQNEVVKEETKEETKDTSSHEAVEAAIENFTVTYLDDGTVKLSRYSGKEETDIIVPSTVDGKDVTVIAEQTFANHDELLSVVLPDTLKEIEYEAFINCFELAHVDLGNSVEIIGERAFLMANLAEINIPASVKKIGECALTGGQYTELTIPKTIEELDEGVFMNNHISTLSVPENIKHIPADTFSGCKLLTEVTIEEGIESIGERAFENCANLEKVTLPSTVTEIHKSAFNDCPSLTYIYIPESVTLIETNEFFDSENLTIHTPAGSYAESYAIENGIAYVND